MRQQPSTDDNISSDNAPSHGRPQSRRPHKKRNANNLKVKVLEVKKDTDGKTSLVSCQMETAKRDITFQFMPESDRPKTIVETLVSVV